MNAGPHALEIRVVADCAACQCEFFVTDLRIVANELYCTVCVPYATDFLTYCIASNTPFRAGSRPGIVICPACKQRLELHFHPATNEAFYPEHSIPPTERTTPHG
jgi:hypothetical protein